MDMVKRKGIGYVIEAIAAIMTLLLFAVGNSPTPPVQDWSTFQKEVAANDMSYILKETGDIEDFMRDREGGSLRTVVEELSSGQLEVAGTVQNLPRDNSFIGFHVIPKQHHVEDVKVAGDSSCDGDLSDDIQNQTGTDILTTEKRPPRHSTKLYFADTDPKISNGFSSETDYDTLYVDNGTPCQFSSAEGPFYRNDFFKWGNSSDPAKYEFYQFKNISSSAFTFNNATQVVKLKKTMKGRLNGIEVDQSFNTFRVSETKLENYDAIVFKQSEALDQIDANLKAVKEYAEDGSILLLMNLQESHFTSSTFLQQTGLRWIDLSYDNPPSGIRFDDSKTAETVQTYLRGFGSRSTDVDVPQGGKISSSNSETIIGEDTIAYGRSGTYAVKEWNVTNYSMQQKDPDGYPSAPESKCYESSKTGNFTLGEFNFRTRDDVKVLNVKLGDTQDYCGKNVRALKFIDDPDPSDSTDETQDPYLNGEEVRIGNRSFIVKTYTKAGNNPFSNGEAAEFIYAGEDDTEMVNYRSSFRGFNGDRLARMGYEPSYSFHDRRMIGSILYWLVGDQSTFGSVSNSKTTTHVLGGIKENTYMPYKLSLRWK